MIKWKNNSLDDELFSVDFNFSVTGGEIFHALVSHFEVCMVRRQRVFKTTSPIIHHALSCPSHPCTHSFIPTISHFPNWMLDNDMIYEIQLFNKNQPCRSPGDLVLSSFDLLIILQGSLCSNSLFQLSWFRTQTGIVKSHQWLRIWTSIWRLVSLSWRWSQCPCALPVVENRNVTSAHIANMYFLCLWVVDWLYRWVWFTPDQSLLI